MRKLVLSCLAIGLCIGSIQAQTLFTYGTKPVSKQEFLRVYQKNAVNKKTDFSEPALREYLDLYSLFKMKVIEAENMHLDTLQSISSELDNYRHQLSKNYLTDKDVSEKLIREAYDRMKEEVHVAHILVSCSPMALPADSAAAYNKIDSLYKLITQGKADFSAVATAVSDDKATRPTGGDIGYLTALQTLYPFENAAYGTSVGKISKPIRTQFGYHIIKVLDRRASHGEIQVAHILLLTPKSKGEEYQASAKSKADSVALLLKHGVPFDTLVARYSEDKLSLPAHGVLAPFGVGRMVPAFENAAFALKKPGDISAPVQTEYGYHILKLIRKFPLKPYDTLRAELKRKVDNDSRSQIAHDEFMNKIKQAHGFKQFPVPFTEVLNKMKTVPDTGAKANVFHASDYNNLTAPLFEIGGTPYLQNDFVRFAENLTRGRINGPKEAVIRDIYKLYVEHVVNDFEEHSLAENNPDFKNLMDEYRNGIMIFELMDRNVWTKATRDTVGLKAYYDAHKDKYMWEPGFTGTVYRFKDEANMKKGLAVLQTPKSTEADLNKALNMETNPEAYSVQKMHYEFNRFKDIPQSDIVKGKPSKAIRNSDGSYTVVFADAVYTTATTKTLDESRGYVSAEYQDALEKSWQAQLRAKYPVKVDESVFHSMVK